MLGNIKPDYWIYVKRFAYLNGALGSQTTMLLTILFLMLFLTPGSTEAASRFSEISYRIKEETKPETKIGNVLENLNLDVNLLETGTASLQILADSPEQAHFFRLSHSNGDLFTHTMIDRDQICPRRETCVLIFDVRANMGEVICIIKIDITIEDINDNAPLFKDPSISLSISEAAVHGFPLSLPTASDPDGPEFGINSYYLSVISPVFKLDKLDEDPRLVLVGDLDHEEQSRYSLQLVARDGGKPPRTGSLNITIRVLDINDNRPQFDKKIYEIEIPEDMRVGATIMHVSAHDADSGENGRIRYTFSKERDQLYGTTFTVLRSTGGIILQGKLDYETQRHYKLSVRASDHGHTPLHDLAKVIIHVKDVNDEKPVIQIHTDPNFKNGVVRIKENGNASMFVSHLTIHDADKGRNGEFDCKLNSPYFVLKHLNKDFYNITTNKSLDREEQSRLELKVVCEDRGIPSLSSTSTISIEILDVNDNDPQFLYVPYIGEINENNQIGMHILTVTAKDKDDGENGRVEYFLKQDPEKILSIHQTSGAISARQVFDFERRYEYSCIIAAEDNGFERRTSTTEIKIRIRDVNDEPPRFSLTKYTFQVSENTNGQVDVGTVSAKDEDASPYNDVNFSIDRQRSKMDSFSIDPKTGIITTKKKLDRELEQSHTLVVIATDSGQPPLSSSATVIVQVEDTNDNIPIIDFPSLYNHTVYVSVNIPVGYKITEVRARDVDTGENSLLIYSLTSEPGQQGTGKFGIDTYTGVVTLRSSFDNIDSISEFSGTVHVRDSGEPPRTASAQLKIVFDRSIPFVPEVHDVPQPRKDRPVLSKRNFLILVVTASASAFLIILLIAVLIYLRKTSNGRSEFKYYSSVAQTTPYFSAHASTNQNPVHRRPDCIVRQQSAPTSGSILRKSRDNFLVVLEHSTSPQSTLYRSQSSLGNEIPTHGLPRGKEKMTSAAVRTKQQTRTDDMMLDSPPNGYVQCYRDGHMTDDVTDDLALYEELPTQTKHVIEA